MLRVESFVTSHLPGLQSLFNCHLSAVVPGWTLPAHVIAESLERDPCEYVTDPWIVERRTLCAVERGRVLAAAHLLRYGSGPEVSEGFRSAGALEWFLAWPPAPSSRYVFAYSFDEAAEAVLAAAVKQLSSWEVTRQYGGTNLPVPVVSGVPGQWPHISSRLEGAGFKPNPELEEVIYAGALEGPAAPAEPPVPGLELVVTTADGTVRLAGVLDGGTIGHCGWDLGAGRGGEFPALTAWAELADLWVEPAWRRRGSARGCSCVRPRGSASRASSGWCSPWPQRRSARVQAPSMPRLGGARLPAFSEATRGIRLLGKPPAELSRAAATANTETIVQPLCRAASPVGTLAGCRTATRGLSESDRLAGGGLCGRRGPWCSPLCSRR